MVVQHRVRVSLGSSGLPPGRRVREVTESAVVEDADAALPALHAELAR